MNVEAELRALITKRMTQKKEIAPDTKLAEIGIDSLDVVEIVFEIEDKYQIQLPQNNLSPTTATFQDLLTLVEQNILAKEQPADGTEQPA